jgi:hypothetical protein
VSRVLTLRDGGEGVVPGAWGRGVGLITRRVGVVGACTE